MSRPLLLDLYCGAGGAAVGYHRAGFDVVGVDNRLQPDYPFEFVQADALEFLAEAGGFDVIHASPPCQRHTALAKGTNGNSDMHVDLIAPTRAALIATGLPYVIENVPGSPLIDPVTLCGEMFGLRVIRHRLFEGNVGLIAPGHLKHRGRVHGHRHGKNHQGWYYTVAGHGRGADGNFAQWCEAMEIDWMTHKSTLVQAIPPAYSQYVGGYLRKAIGQ